MTPRIAVCLVDDDAPVVSALMRSFVAQWTVTAATKGRDAYEILCSSAEFDAILLDCFMPDMTGLEIYEKLLEHGMLARCQRIAFFTAGADHPTLGPALEQTGRPIIAKPADMGAIDKVVRALASQPGSRGPYIMSGPPPSPRPMLDAFASDTERKTTDAIEQALKYRARELPDVTEWEESPTKTRIVVPNTDTIRKAIEEALDRQKKQAALELAAGRWATIVKGSRWVAIELLKGLPWYAALRILEHIIRHAPAWLH